MRIEEQKRHLAIDRSFSSYSSFSATGRAMKKELPFPGSLSAQTFP